MKGRFPWWGSVLLAVISYSGLKYGLPRLVDHSSPLIALVPMLAPLSAMGFLLLAGKQLYDTDPEDDQANPGNNR